MIEWIDNNDDIQQLGQQMLGQTEETKSSGFGVGTLLLTAFAAGSAGFLLALAASHAPPPPVTTSQKVITDPHGEPITVAKVDGEWNYWYDGEWTPLRYYGGPGANARIVGNRLVISR